MNDGTLEDIDDRITIPSYKKKTPENFIIDINAAITLYKRAIDAFGRELQFMVTIEEMSELTKELIKYQRMSSRCSIEEHDRQIHKIAEEIADTRIMLEQIELALACADYTKRYRQKKLYRLQTILDDKHTHINKRGVYK